jgi:hypothetical protein
MKSKLVGEGGPRLVHLAAKTSEKSQPDLASLRARGPVAALRNGLTGEL